jgi:Mce-associated membrane protein
MKLFRTSRKTRTTGIAVLLVAVAAIFTAFSGVLVRDHQDAHDQRGTDAAILSAARSGVLAMISVRDTSAADDVKKVLDQSTGAFRKDFEARSQSFIAVVQQAKVVTTGDILAQGIEARADGSATVLVAATSSVSNAAGAANETRSWRLRVTMTEDNDLYKMSNVEFVA